jgi:predicted homoserine dehydrogenase-like protein
MLVEEIALGTTSKYSMYDPLHTGHLNIEYTTLNKAFLKLHENEQMLSLAECSGASISFSKVDKTLRFEARLSKQS